MRGFVFWIVLTAPVFCTTQTGMAQVQSTGTEGQESVAEQLASGKNYISTPVYSEEEDQRILSLFEGLRVADVSDAMDQLGLQDIGLVSPEIVPLWRDTENFRHRIVGIAVTVRYVPPQEPLHGPMEGDEFNRWVGQWYQELSPEPFIPLIRKGTILVIEDHSGKDVGTIGSNNILTWYSKGCVGVVTNATARDTDEIIAEKVPLYYRKPGRGIRPGRNVVESVNRPVVIGGVLIIPGDVIVADGDGVIVVPRKYAEQVARAAREILEKDKAARRAKYEQLGLPFDKSVE